MAETEDNKFNPAQEKFTKVLPQDIKRWFAHAIVGMVCADGIVEPAEMEYLKKAVTFLDDAKEVDQLLDMVKNKNMPELMEMKAVDHAMAYQMMETLAKICVTEKELTDSEGHYLRYVGNRLGYTSAFCEHLVKWTADSCLLKKREKQLKKLGSSEKARES